MRLNPTEAAPVMETIIKPKMDWRGIFLICHNLVRAHPFGESLTSHCIIADTKMNYDEYQDESKSIYKQLFTSIKTIKND